MGNHSEEPMCHIESLHITEFMQNLSNKNNASVTFEASFCALDSCSRLVASFGVKPQLCQLKLKKTHELKQDVYLKKEFTAP